MADERALIPDHPAACCGACGHAADVEAGRVPAHVRGERLQVRVDSGVPALVVQVKHRDGHIERVAATGARLTIGRVQGNDVVIPQGNVSKRQCTIDVVDGGVILQDGKSGCGTFVNGKRIAGPAAVAHGDRVYIGDAVLTFEPAR